MLFSDRGAWHGYTWGEETAFDCVGLDGERTPVEFAGKAVERRAYPDRLEAVLESGETATLRFVDIGAAEIVVGRSYFRHVFLDLEVHGPGEDLDGLPATLRWNWRAPRGDIRHGGVIPSPFAYQGFWAWDSWKHAAVLPKRLAREQIAAMFDYQREDGMVPDTVRLDQRDNNWRCTKPPLAAWACAQHEGLLDEFRPALERYHAWWENNRRPPGERLFAYGGDDLEASKWESGWDNATRYDDVRLVGGLQDVLSVDLNAYLCLEKRLLGRPDPELERLVNEVFFHDGAFFDVTWPDHRPVRTLTAATWIPLWCGIADEARARSVIDVMLDPEHFRTPLPFPTVARSDPKFDPDGYWRGAVWFDHAAWAVEVLLRYGREAEARADADRLLSAPWDWECYNPLTGEPAGGERPAVPQFSWTAAARRHLERLLGLS